MTSKQASKVNRRKAKELEKRGIEAYRAWNMDQAVQYLREAIRVNPGVPDYLINLARALAATGRVAQAVDQLGICLRLRPGMAEARGLLCELRARASAGGE